MKQKCNYFITELKGVAGVFLSMIFSFVIIAALLFLLFAGVSSVAEKQETKAAITLGIALPEQDSIFKTVIGFANGLTSLKGFCRMEVCSEDELHERLENGQYDMGISVPADFYEKANSMQPADFTLYTPADMTLSEKKLISILESVERVMVVTEGGIVAMYHGMEVYDFPFTQREMEDAVTGIYVSQFMARDKCFDAHFLSPYGNYSFLEYYTASILLIVTLISSIGMVKLYNIEKLSFERIFFKGSSVRIECSLMKIIAMGIGFSTMLCIMMFLGNMGCEIAGSSFIFAKGETYLSLLLIGVSIALYYHVLGSLLSAEREGKVITVVILTLIMPLLSGAFIPVAYFPKWLEVMSHFLPFTAWQRLVLEGTFGMVKASSVVIVAIFDILMLAAGIFIYDRKIKKNG